MPGTYWLLGTYSLTFFDPGEQDVLKPIWNDYVAARFEVMIAR